jgi:hypothetical protein
MFYACGGTYYLLAFIAGIGEIIGSVLQKDFSTNIFGVVVCRKKKLTQHYYCLKSFVGNIYQ